MDVLTSCSTGSVASRAKAKTDKNCGLQRTGLLKQQTGLEGCGPRPFWLVISGVSGTRGNTQLFFKRKVLMLEMRLGFS